MISSAPPDMTSAEVWNTASRDTFSRIDHSLTRAEDTANSGIASACTRPRDAHSVASCCLNISDSEKK